VKALTFGLALLLVLNVPVAAQPQHHGGGAPRAAAPRPAAPPRAVGGGFNLNRDITAPAERQAPPAAVTRPPGNVNYSRPPVTGGRNHIVITNPAYHGHGAWGWNRGTVWAAAPHYWGGGFWGPFALGAAAVALGVAAYGSFTDPSDNAVLTSYQVAPGSPGAALLENYGLTQTPCGPDGLVVIFGPDGSVICANPNNLVGPGEYNLDPSDLTLVSQ